MKLTITRKAACNTAVFLAASGTFTACTVNGLDYLNSGWICAVAGFIIALPFLFLLSKIRLETRHGRLLMILPAVIFIYKAADMMVLILDTVNYSDLEDLSTVLIAGITLLFAMYAVCKNGCGIGNAIKVIMPVIVFLVAVILVANYNEIHLRALTPVIGPGCSVLLRGSIKVAGNIAMPALLLLIAEDSNNSTSHVIWRFAKGTFISVILCLIWGSQIPAWLSGYSRLHGIGRLLANGKSPLASQLSVTAGWFIALIAAISAHTFCAAAFLQRAFKKTSGKAAVLIVVIAIFALHNTAPAETMIGKVIDDNLIIAAGAIATALALGGKIIHRRTENV